jgi:FkbM family methyltransferase
LSSRLALGPIVVPFVNNSTLIAEPGMHSATGNIFWGLSEPEEMAFCLHLLRPGDTFLDVGANVGVFTILARATGADVISIEPGPAAFAALERNVTANGYRADLRNVAVSDYNGSGRFAYNGASTTNRLAMKDEELPSIVVPVETLDSIIEGRSVTVLKIDIEGHELAAFTGASSLLASPSLKAIIAEANALSDRREMLDLIKNAGFVATAYNPYTRTLTAADKSASDNLIFVREIEATQRTLTEAPRFSLSGGLASI